MYFLENNFAHHRFAVSVNRKIGNAVQRNYIKRKMKEFFRINRHLVKRAHDLWVVTKSRFDRERAVEVEGLFIQSLEKVNGFKKK